MAWAVSIILAGALCATAQTGEALASPAAGWGVSSSAHSLGTVAEWFPVMSGAGIAHVRGFPEWRGLEPARGGWKWDGADALVKCAAENGIEIDAILMGSAAWSGAGAHAFPMEQLDDWSVFVSNVVHRYGDRIHSWEVWNEGNGGFNDGHHATDACFSKMWGYDISFRPEQSVPFVVGKVEVSRVAF